LSKIFAAAGVGDVGLSSMGASCSSPQDLKGHAIEVVHDDASDAEVGVAVVEEPVDTYYRGPVLVILDTVTLLPAWREWTGVLTARASARCESVLDGSLRGCEVEWPLVEVPCPGVPVVLNRPLALGCRREEGLVLRLKVTVQSADLADGFADGRRTAVVTGSLLLDAVPLEVLEPRRVSLLEGADLSGHPATPEALNSALLLGDRWGEAGIRFLPEPPRVKTLFLVRHAESEWNEAQRNRNVRKMLGQVDHPLTCGGMGQVRRLQSKVQRLAGDLAREASAAAARAEGQRARSEASAARALHTARRLATRAEKAADAEEAEAARAAAAAKRRGLFGGFRSSSSGGSGGGHREGRLGSTSMHGVELGHFGNRSEGKEEDKDYDGGHHGHGHGHGGDDEEEGGGSGGDYGGYGPGPEALEDHEHAAQVLLAVRGERTRALERGDDAVASRITVAVARARDALSEHRAAAEAAAARALQHRSARHSLSHSQHSSQHSQHGHRSAVTSGADHAGRLLADATVGHLERKFLGATVLSSPLCRALQTALLALAPACHPGLLKRGVGLLSDAREVKKSRGSFDCVASVTGDGVRQRAVDLVVAAPRPLPPLDPNDCGGSSGGQGGQLSDTHGATLGDGGAEWRVFERTDVFPGEDWPKAWSGSPYSGTPHSLAAAREKCVAKGLGGFVVFRGRAYFRKHPPSELLHEAKTGGGGQVGMHPESTLHVAPVAGWRPEGESRGQRKKRARAAAAAAKRGESAAAGPGGSGDHLGGAGTGASAQSGQLGRSGPSGTWATNRALASAQAEAVREATALAAAVVHAGDAGNEGSRWWTVGVESGREGAARVRALVRHLRLLPDRDLCMVCHSHLIREVFRTFAPADPGVGGAAVRELTVEKLENCGVVALRMDFGRLLPGDCGDGPLAGPPRYPYGAPGHAGPEQGGGERAAGGGSLFGGVHDCGVLFEEGEPKYITDAVYLFGSGVETK